MPDPTCVFCKIVDGSIPSAKVFAADRVISFLDIGPVSRGHLLIIPSGHYSNLIDLPGEVASEMAGLLPRLGAALLRVTGAEGFNLLVNSGTAAGQEVLHVHWHLIPRSTGDGLGYRWNAGQYAAGEMETLQKAFLESL